MAEGRCPCWLAAFLLPMLLQAQRPEVQALVDSVRIDSMVSYAEQLSG